MVPLTEVSGAMATPDCRTWRGTGSFGFVQRQVADISDNSVTNQKTNNWFLICLGQQTNCVVYVWQFCRLGYYTIMRPPMLFCDMQTPALKEQFLHFGA